MPTPFQPGTLYDALGSFGGGVNEGDSPLDLAPDTASDCLNVTFRGKHPTHRPAYFRRIVTYDSNATQTAVESGYFQGACEYLADDFTASLLALISGRLFQFTIQGNVVNGAEIQITLQMGNPTPPVQPQAWLWQAEYFVIITDGLNPTVIFDGNAVTATQSNYGTPVQFSVVTAASFVVPAVGSQVGPFALLSTTNLNVGDVVTVLDVGLFQVVAVSSPDVTLLNLTGTPVGLTTLSGGTTLVWQHTGEQLPPGRMGTYGMQRIWMSLVDGKQFVAGDISGGASGTLANNFRDAVINITENLFLVGGGNFIIPSSGDTIQAMRFVSILDASLGQGPLQIFTQKNVFSCQAPVDRLTWQSVTNPILTESLIGSGGTGQYSTVMCNGDAIFRSPIGAGSLILARQDFDTWGNVPISFEVSVALANDDVGLLSYASAVNFDNRYVLTYGPVQDPQGVYFPGFVAINFDELSSLRGKAPSIWDGPWSGLNTLKLTNPTVANVPRCFAFVLNKTTGATGIQLWEILTSEDSINDNDGTKDIPITWRFDSASLRFGVDKKDHQYLSLSNGEIWIDEAQPGATLTFDVYYKADLYPCWTPWFNWQACVSKDANESQPGFYPRMGYGEPDNGPIDNFSGRPLRQGFTFQTRRIITGHCVFIGEFLEVNRIPQQKFAPMMTSPICQTT